MSDDDKKEAPKATTPLAAASDRIRSTAQWVVVTFGAVAGVMLAGLQLTSLGETEGSDRTTAVVGYALAVGGIVVVILAAAITLTAGRVSTLNLKTGGGPMSLGTRLNAIPILRSGFPSTDALVTAVNDALVARLAAWQAWRKDPSPQKKEAYDAAIADATLLSPLADRLLDVASYEKLKRTWSICRFFIVVGVLVAAVGTGLFAANTSASTDEEADAVSQRPAAAELLLTPAGVAAHQAELGAECKLGAISVIVTSSSADDFTATVVPTPKAPCGPAVITVQRSEGSLSAAKAVDLG